MTVSALTPSKVGGAKANQRAGESLYERFDFDLSKPDLRILYLDGNLSSRERNKLSRILRIGLFEFRRRVHGPTIDDVGRSISLPNDFNGIPAIEHFKIPILNFAEVRWVEFPGRGRLKREFSVCRWP